MNVMRILTSVMVTPTVKIRMARTTVRVAMDIEVMAETVLVSPQKLIQIMVNGSNRHILPFFPGTYLYISYPIVSLKISTNARKRLTRVKRTHGVRIQ